MPLCYDDSGQERDTLLVLSCNHPLTGQEQDLQFLMFIIIINLEVHRKLA